MTSQIIRTTAVVTFLTVSFVLAKPAKKKSTKPKVQFLSECLCKNNTGVDRWAPKTDASPIPLNPFAITKITPSGIYAWKGPGPNVPLTRKTETRLPAEQKWYSVTGRVVDVRVERDGDIHVMLQDATGPSKARVGAEVPLGPDWCSIRKEVFSWTNAKIPFQIQSNGIFKILKPHVVTVTGKAFYDVDHAPKNHSNHSTIHANTAAWEIHPVRDLSITQ